MKLVAIKIENCRSIEKAELLGLEQINVLVGRNNAGKSSFFHALQFVAGFLRGQGQNWDRTLRSQRKLGLLKIELEFELTVSEREQFFRTVLKQVEPVDQHLSAFMRTSAFSRAEFAFELLAPQVAVLVWKRTRALSADGNWVESHRLAEPVEYSANPVIEYADFTGLSAQSSFRADALQLGQGIPAKKARLQVHEWIAQSPSNPNFYLQLLCTNYLTRAFFLNASRRTNDFLEAEVGAPLERDGTNLPQVLLGLNSNNSNVFERVRRFVREAIPDCGELQTPIKGKQTRIGLRMPEIVDTVPILDMGTGVQHIVMMAYLLEATSQDQPIFLEEPETNLHPGAQRFLLEKFREDGRQFFLTTHSPIPLALGDSISVYRVESVGNSTRATRVTTSAEQASVLAELGVRNSDILFCDAVIFVEGESDRDILHAFAETLGISLDAKGIAVLLLGSSEAAAREASTRSDIIANLSRATTVPHRFLFDRDERSDAELKNLSRKLADKVHVLKRREIENYFLDAKLLQSYLGDRLSNENKTVPKYLTDDWTQNKITKVAGSLKKTVLLKRVRARVGGLEGGAFPRDFATELSNRRSSRSLAKSITTKLTKHHSQWLRRARLSTLVKAEQKAVDDLWRDEEKMFRAVPGADLLDALFQEVGLRFDKRRDGPALAARVSKEQIPAEFVQLLSWDPSATKN